MGSARWPRVIRYAVDGDRPLILDSWMAQARDALEEVSLPGWQVSHRKLLAELIDRVTPICACHPEHPGQVYGWACGDTYAAPTLHMVYVRSAWRNDGIGTELMRRLFPSFPLTATYCSHKGSAFGYRAKPWNLVFNPYTLASTIAGRSAA